MSTRLATGGRLLNKSKPVNFTFNGKQLRGYEGDTLASALLANDVRVQTISKFRPVFAAFAVNDLSIVQIRIVPVAKVLRPARETIQILFAVLHHRRYMFAIVITCIEQCGKCRCGDSRTR